MVYIRFFNHFCEKKRNIHIHIFLEPFVFPFQIVVLLSLLTNIVTSHPHSTNISYTVQHLNLHIAVTMLLLKFFLSNRNQCEYTLYVTFLKSEKSLLEVIRPFLNTLSKNQRKICSITSNQIMGASSRSSFVTS